MKTKAYYVFLFAIIFSLISCNVSPESISMQTARILSQQVQNKPYVALIEGLQPFSGESMNDLGQKLSLECNVSAYATSGNHDAHMPIIREANRNHQKIYIAGFSTGEREAVLLSEDCEREGIPVEILFLLDGVRIAKIHTTVKNVFDILGTKPYVFRRPERYGQKDLENKGTGIRFCKLECGHLDVPAKAYPIFFLCFHKIY
jgi:hypothetical protein